MHNDKNNAYKWKSFTRKNSAGPLSSKLCTVKRSLFKTDTGLCLDTSYGTRSILIKRHDKFLAKSITPASVNSLRQQLQSAYWSVYWCILQYINCYCLWWCMPCHYKMIHWLRWAVILYWVLKLIIPPPGLLFYDW